MKSIIESFVKYKIWANALIILTFVIGIMSLLNVKNTSFPIEPSSNISVQVTYPGAAPEEIEEGVVLKIEEALKGIEGVKEITSTSRENFGSVNVEILSDYDIDEMVTEVKNGVDRISSFPVGAEKPIVFKVKAVDLVGIILLQGEVTRKKLREYSNLIEDELLQAELSKSNQKCNSNSNSNSNNSNNSGYAKQKTTRFAIMTQNTTVSLMAADNPIMKLVQTRRHIAGNALAWVLDCAYRFGI
jgi:hypothetical protein